MRVRVGRVGKPFGVSGQVTVQVTTDEPELRFRPHAELLCDDRRLRIRGVARSGNRWLLAFAGVADRDEAERLRGAQLFCEVGEEERPDDPQEWYDRDLIGLGCTSPDGQALGTVVAVEHPPAQDLLVVRTPAGHDARVPFVSAIVTDASTAGLIIDAPGGLLEPDFEVPQA